MYCGSMLSVAVLMSGPHRMAMLEQAIDSIPIDSPAVSRVILRHQGGPWDWGGALRERMEAHPKVRIIEFPDRVDFAHSFNRTIDAVETPWVLLLPDDDYLVRPVARDAFEAIAALDAASYGFAAFGWWYLKDERYLASYMKRRDLYSMLHYTPKFCSTLMNVGLVRAVGGFPNHCGGLLDAALFARLAFEHDALISRAPIGVYRLHGGQESARRLPTEHIEALRASIGPFARNPAEREMFERRLQAAIDAKQPTGAMRQLVDLGFQLRSRSAPSERSRDLALSTWYAPDSVMNGVTRALIDTLRSPYTAG